MWPAVLCRADTTQLVFNPRAVLTCLLPTLRSLAGTDCASLLGADIGLDNRMINCVNCLAIRFFFCCVFLFRFFFLQRSLIFLENK